VREPGGGEGGPVQGVSGGNPGAEGSDELDVSGSGQKLHDDPPFPHQLAACRQT